MLVGGRVDRTGLWGIGTPSVCHRQLSVFISPLSLELDDSRTVLTRGRKHLFRQEVDELKPNLSLFLELVSS